MEEEKSARSSTGRGGGLVAVFVSPEDENKSGRLIGLVRWRTKRAPDNLRVGGGVCCSFFNPKMRIRMVG